MGHVLDQAGRPINPAKQEQLPASLAAGGGLKVEGVAGGVAVGVATRGEAPTTTAVTIPSGQSLSAPVDLRDKIVVQIVMPAAWTAAALTFQASADGVTYGNLYTSSGGEYSLSADASRVVLVPPSDLLGHCHLKVRSGAAAVPVNQAADRVLTLVVRPV